MSDKDTRGIYEKFTVERTDGQSKPGGKHNGCRYFVLDLDHDPYSKPAITAYAAACHYEHPKLADELMDLALEPADQR